MRELNVKRINRIEKEYWEEDKVPYILTARRRYEFMDDEPYTTGHQHMDDLSDAEEINGATATVDSCDVIKNFYRLELSSYRKSLKWLHPTHENPKVIGPPCASKDDCLSCASDALSNITAKTKSSPHLARVKDIDSVRITAKPATTIPSTEESQSHKATLSTLAKNATTTFSTDFNDNELTEEHQSYISKDDDSINKDDMSETLMLRQTKGCNDAFKGSDSSLHTGDSIKRVLHKNPGVSVIASSHLTPSMKIDSTDSSAIAQETTAGGVSQAATSSVFSTESIHDLANTTTVPSMMQTGFTLAHSSLPSTVKCADSNSMDEDLPSTSNAGMIMPSPLTHTQTSTNLLDDPLPRPLEIPSQIAPPLTSWNEFADIANEWAWSLQKEIGKQDPL